LYISIEIKYLTNEYDIKNLKIKIKKLEKNIKKLKISSPPDPPPKRIINEDSYQKDKGK